jgi:ribosomal protein L32
MVMLHVCPVALVLMNDIILVEALAQSDDTPGHRGYKKLADNPMKQDLEIKLANLSRAPRCGALTRAGTVCQRPSLRGRKRCRLHGGLSPGAPRGTKNGNFRNGNWTAGAIEERRWLRSLVQAFASAV